jgi:hypothetical protein
MASLLRLLVLCFVLFGSINAQVPSYVPSNGLVGWWGFNGNANDESGNGNHGTVFGASMTSDRFGNSNKAYSFNGTSDYIKMLNPGPLGNTSRSVCVWVKTTDQSSSIILSYGNGDYKNFNLWSNYKCSGINFDITGASRTFNSSFLNGQWNHYVFVYDNSLGSSFTVTKVYENGTLLTTTCASTGSGTINTANGYPISVGKFHESNTEYLSGSIDDIGIWNRALTQTEITSLYESVIPITATASTVTNVSCFNGNNGSATVSPSGGVPPYSYSWNSSPIQTTQTATGLRAGVYTVTVTDSRGTMTTANATITQPNALTNVLATTITNVGCFGGNNGSATVTNPTGGTPPYTYQWNTNPQQITQTATNLTAGSYMVTVTDTKGCTATSSVTITQPAQPLSNVIGQTIQHAKCNGSSTGSVTVSNPIGGTPPYTYKWNSVPEQKTQIATNLSAGTYSVTVTDFNGCTATSFATVNEPTKVTNVQASVVKNISCYGLSDGSAKVSDPRGGTPPYTYQWNTIPVQNTQTATNLKAGEYVVVVSDANGCIAQSLISITQPNAPLVIGNAKVDKQVSCFGESDGAVSVPNPTGGTAPYTIVWNTNPVQKTYSISNLKAGTYTAIITDANGCNTSASATVIEPSQVVVSSPKDTTVLIQTVAFMKAGSNNPISTYQWQTNTGTGFSNLQNVFQYSGVTTNTLRIENCTSSNHNQPFRCIISTNGCLDTSAIAVLAVRTNVGVKGYSQVFQFTISPNPTGESDQFLVRFAEIPNQDVSIELLDILGSIHYSNTLQAGSESCSIPVQGLSSGMYMLRVRMNNEVFIEKVIVN